MRLRPADWEVDRAAAGRIVENVFAVEPDLRSPVFAV